MECNLGERKSIFSVIDLIGSSDLESAFGVLPSNTGKEWEWKMDEEEESVPVEGEARKVFVAIFRWKNETRQI